jgi:NhaP-type Na+/H+ or K+/H+ antiporter
MASTHEQLLLLSLFMIVALGAIVKHTFSKIPIPYTVVLMGLGCILGAISTTGDQSHPGDFQLSTTRLSKMDPHLLLFVFLPPLLFESAFNMDVAVFRRVFSQVLLLAGPGLLVSTFVSGGLSYLLLDDWRFIEALLLGAIVSATDPVAVVALLNDLGAPKQLGHLIEGESLLNDGTAIVCYSVIIEAVKDANYLTDQGAGGVIWTFIKMALGGCLVGAAFGWVAVFWIRRVFNDPLIEITITMSFTYLTFFIAEHTCHFSGVIAVVVFGLYTNLNRLAISPEVAHFLHEFWCMIGYLANTVIFVQIGLILYLENSATLLNGTKWGILFRIYLICTLARLLCFSIFAPALSHMGGGMTWQEGAVSVWGGLRGAVGLALALGAKPAFGDDAASQQVYEDLLFYVSGIVLLTLVVNGTTMERLVKTLGLDGVSATEYVALKSVKGNLKSNAARMMSSLKRDPLFCGADFDHAAAYVPEFTLPRCIELSDSNGSDKVTTDASASGLSVAHVQLAKIVRGSYIHSHEYGSIGDQARNKLLESASKAIEKAVNPMEDWLEFAETHALGHQFSDSGGARSAMNAASACMSGRLCEHGSGDVALQFELLCAFIIARKELEDHVPRVTQDPNLVRTLREQCIDSRHAASKVLRQMSRESPNVHRSVQTAAVARKVLYDQRRMMEAVAHEGVVEEGQKEKFVEHVEAGLKSIMAQPPRPDMPSQDALLSESSWLPDNSDDICQSVLQAVTQAKFDAGAVLLQKGEVAGSMFVITSGLVDCAVVETDFAGAGSTVGLRSLLTGTPTQCKVGAQEAVGALELSREKVVGLMARHSQLASAMWKSIGTEVAHELLQHVLPFKNWPHMKLAMFLERATVEKVANNERVTIPGNTVAVILLGEARNDSRRKIDGFVKQAPILLTDGREEEQQGFMCQGSPCAWVMTMSVEHAGILESGEKANQDTVLKEVAVVDNAEELIQAGYHGDIPKATAILKEGLYDINGGDYDKRTALHLACAEGHLQMVQFLMESGANADAQDRFGRTPLEECVLNKHDAIADVLRAHGVVPLQGSKLTDQMLSLAKDGDLDGIKRLVDNGASVNTADYGSSRSLAVLTTLPPRTSDPCAVVRRRPPPP